MRSPSLPPELRRRAAAWPVARLATVSPDGQPRLVPCCFVVDGDVLYSAVDHKPKRTARLARLDDIRANPLVGLVVDHYEDDWSALWWVRVEGRARLLDDGPERDRAVALLAGKYPQYAARPPAGTVIAVDVTRWSGWSAGPAAGPTPNPPGSAR